MEVKDNILLIVGDLQGILDQQLRPHPEILFLFYKLILVNYIMFHYYIIKETEDHPTHLQKWRVNGLVGSTTALS